MQYIIETCVESTTIYLFGIADMASLCIWMHPFTIKGLESQCTDIATLLCGDAKGFRDNAVSDGNEQMTAYRTCTNPFKEEISL